uniref:Cyclin-like domain-containing protein n=1 Tax=Timema tahoe TaxID=61484 RepID=A0A7R9IB05_9NEOP|nr:unnamed protein product [Timema tahoe]
MGQKLQVTQLCINTAIVYMHRFYVFHSFTQFHRHSMAAAALFLAAKVEEQPRKLEHVIKISHMCLHREQPTIDTKSEQYLELAQDLVFNENVLLQTLGFDVAIDHPHTNVVRCCELVNGKSCLSRPPDAGSLYSERHHVNMGYKEVPHYLVISQIITFRIILRDVDQRGAVADSWGPQMGFD